jgi:hypothetical protein
MRRKKMIIGVIKKAITDRAMRVGPSQNGTAFNLNQRAVQRTPAAARVTLSRYTHHPLLGFGNVSVTNASGSSDPSSLIPPPVTFVLLSGGSV